LSEPIAYLVALAGISVCVYAALEDGSSRRRWALGLLGISVALAGVWSL
jgi:hypothetical protein